MRLAPLALAVGVLVPGAVACSDDAEDPPPATGTEDAFCRELRTTVVEHDTIFDPLQPTTAEETQAATARLADAAPAEVAEPMRLLADTFADVAGVLEEHDPSDPETPEALAELGIDEDAIADAQEAVSTYALEVCGIDLDAINAASVTTTPAAPTATTVPSTTLPATTVPPVDTTAPPVTG
jgi:hypothetical protein